MAYFTTSVPGSIIVSVGSTVLAVEPAARAGFVDVDVELADYDYEPFIDPDAPPFEFVADVIRVGADLTTTIDQAVVCISYPGRISREKEI